MPMNINIYIADVRRALLPVNWVIFAKDKRG
jgi:hypothetical protein